MLKTKPIAFHSQSNLNAQNPSLPHISRFSSINESEIEIPARRQHEKRIRGRQIARHRRRALLQIRDTVLRAAREAPMRIVDVCSEMDSDLTICISACDYTLVWLYEIFFVELCVCVFVTTRGILRCDNCEL